MISDSEASGIEPSNESVYYCAHVTRPYLFERDLQVLMETKEGLIRMEDFFM